MKHTVRAKLDAVERLEEDLRTLASALLFQESETEISVAGRNDLAVAERAVRDSVIDLMVVLEPDDDADLDALMARELAEHPPPPDIVDRDDPEPGAGLG